MDNNEAILNDLLDVIARNEKIIKELKKSIFNSNKLKKKLTLFCLCLGIAMICIILFSNAPFAYLVILGVTLVYTINSFKNCNYCIRNNMYTIRFLKDENNSVLNAIDQLNKKEN